MDKETNFEINIDMNSDKSYSINSNDSDCSYVDDIDDNINVDDIDDNINIDNIDQNEFSLRKKSVLILHEISSKNVDEIVLNLLELYVHHKWTKASLRDTLAMLRKVIPEGNQLPISVFQLFQYIKNRTPSFNVIKHSYCKICLSYNGIESKINKCFSCNFV